MMVVLSRVPWFVTPALIALGVVVLARYAAGQWRKARSGQPDAWGDDLQKGRLAGASSYGKETWLAQGLRHLLWILSQWHGVREFHLMILAILALFVVVNWCLASLFYDLLTGKLPVIR